MSGCFCWPWLACNLQILRRKPPQDVGGARSGTEDQRIGNRSLSTPPIPSGSLSGSLMAPSDVTLQDGEAVVSTASSRHAARGSSSQVPDPASEVLHNDEVETSVGFTDYLYEQVAEEEMQTCRICLEEGRTTDLVSPCVCRGSSKYVHTECLEACFRASGSLINLECPTCKHAYEGPAAVHLGEVALQEIESQFGTEHALVATGLHNLGIARGVSGDAEGQRKLLERALDIQERHYGTQHSIVATTLVNLANAYYCLGDIPRQRHLLERALNIHESQDSVDNQSIATALVNLSSVHGMMGEPLKQRELLERALSIVNGGSNDRMVATILVYLSIACAALREPDKQLELLEKALHIYEQEFGPDHRALGTTLVNLASAYGRQGEVEKQRSALERAIRIKQRDYGPDHWEVAKALVILANAVGDAGDLDRQQHYLERALGILERHFGKGHRETACALGSLGVVYGKRGDMKKKQVALESMLEIMVREFGPEHRNVAITLLELASTCESLGETERQQEHTERAQRLVELGALQLPRDDVAREALPEDSEAAEEAEEDEAVMQSTVFGTVAKVSVVLRHASTTFLHNCRCNRRCSRKRNLG